MLPASRCRHKTIADTFNYINTITFSQYFDIAWKLFISGSSTCILGCFKRNFFLSWVLCPGFSYNMDHRNQ